MQLAACCSLLQLVAAPILHRLHTTHSHATSSTPPSSPSASASLSFCLRLLLLAIVKSRLLLHHVRLRCTFRSSSRPGAAFLGVVFHFLVSTLPSPPVVARGGTSAMAAAARRFRRVWVGVQCPGRLVTQDLVENIPGVQHERHTLTPSWSAAPRLGASTWRHCRPCAGRRP